MIKLSQDPYGYRKLLVCQKAEALQAELSKFVSAFPKDKTLIALADQMERSARSTKQNIVEGWKRNSTNEYYQFLGFAIASNAELEEDCTDICKGIYESKGLKGMKGEKWEVENLDKIPFYPLNSLLPLCIQLKLRAKEINFLIHRLQQSLTVKMREDSTLPTADRIRTNSRQAGEAEKWLKDYLAEQGFVRLDNGKVIKREKREKK